MVEFKKVLSYIPFFLFILYFILPMMKLIEYLTGYDFDDYLLIVVITIFSMAAPLVLKRLHISLGNRGRAFSALLLPLSLVNGFIFISSGWYLSAFFALLCFTGSLLMMVLFGLNRELKIAMSVISGMMFCCWCIVTSIMILFSAFTHTWEEVGGESGGLTSRTEVKSVASPENTYIAKVMDNNEGAMGGNTAVDLEIVIDDDTTSTIYQIYRDRWGVGEEMKIWWKDDHLLVINEKEYEIWWKDENNIVIKTTKTEEYDVREFVD